ncbi:MAG TPA: MerR family transcriptional regulator [Dietzia timorensis]|uniref:MerR family transcriptional regulator n=1 Tax=Dietzia timorensis TaxID=499555 RepID=A0A921JXJ2_9ACTN|nr:MerR family transcriptional regulator [Dietzia timorensis]HJE89898.1 MerR family transcriptional regulator [Dietzia timorensis]
MTETIKRRAEHKPSTGQDTFAVAQAAELLAMSAHTIRYYERAGLLAVPRDSAGNRCYGEPEMRRLEFLRRMRASGMSMAALTRYIELVAEGESTVPERLALMQAHRDGIVDQLRELRAALAATDYKIATYGGELDGQCPPSTSIPDLDSALPDLNAVLNAPTRKEPS